MPDPEKKRELTKTQAAAARLTGKNILVSAGAGTGKTSVLVERFLHFLTVKQIPVTEILALTFTEKAANEMKSRIMKELNSLGLEAAKQGLESAYISTFHAFAARLLREHPLEAGVDPDFRVVESEESDFLKEQSLDEAIESRCEKGNEIFELLKIYGEGKVRGGILKVLDAARHEGKYLTEFFSYEKNQPELEDPSGIFEKLGEKELAGQWVSFKKKKTWDWPCVEEFRQWYKPFSRRGGAKNKADWKEIAQICQRFLASKIDLFMAPWAGRFKTLALAFEEIYERKKKEGSYLDFNDLEIKAIRLFKAEGKVSARLRERYQKKFRQILVDEFQDTNLLQIELIGLLAGDGNLFFVGDYKQSIYGFRGAEPGLFLEKEKDYAASGESEIMDLADNFRTSRPVLDFINDFFRDLWSEDGFNYKPLEVKVEAQDGAGVELMTVKIEGGESIDSGRMKEASMIAGRIRQLYDEGVPYGDMALLFQAMTDTGIYEQALKKRGIPYYAVSSRGFYHQPEIRDMVSFLSFLENPRADIPLAAALRSPLFQISDDTLFWLSHRVKAKEKRQDSTPLYEGVKLFEDIAGIPQEQKERIAFFLRVTREILVIKDRLKLTELLDLILERTSYELTMLADPQGVRKYANLKKMVSLARQLENREPLRLGAFLRTLKRLESQEVRESEAQVEAEASKRVVRILSVHRAKGLEFPVVFVPDMARSRQSSDSNAIVCAAGQGFAMKVRNEITLEDEEPLSWIEIHEQANRKDKEEWKRLFYVAVTRAKNKLILAGVQKDKKEIKASYYDMSCWLDWLLCRENPLLEIRKPDALPSGKSPAKAAAKHVREYFPDFMPQPAEVLIPDSKEREAARAAAEKIAAAVGEKKRFPSRAMDLPVSAYAAFRKDPRAWWRVYQIGYGDAPIETKPEAFAPADDSGEGPSAADFGTLVHRVLEHLDFKDPSRNLTALIDKNFYSLREEDKREAARILQEFIKTPVFARLQKAKRIYRELPFVLNGRHGRIDGVIDMLFEEKPGQWHVLDYKTAMGDDAKVREAGYDFQIGLYALAAHEMLGITPLSGIVYFLKNHHAGTVPFEDKSIRAFRATLDDAQEDILEFNRKMMAGTGVLEKSS